MAKARRGEGLGEEKGEAVEDLVRLKAGGGPPKPGGVAREALGMRGDGEDEGCICHGAGEELRMSRVRTVGGEVPPDVASRWRQRMASTAASRALPERLASLRSTSSTPSVLSSSAIDSSCSTGKQRS